MRVLDPQGQEIYKNINKAEDTAGVFNIEVFHNVYAKAFKDAYTLFLNNQGNETLNSYAAKEGNNQPRINVREILGDMKPANSGTGFYINNDGQLITAAHVIDECIIIDVQHKGVKQQANTVVSSRVLDLAVLQVEQPPQAVSSLLSSSETSALGAPLFTTGYPLSTILAEFPSMTMGNLSSMGGLRGAQGHFQFSAPIQPGNSGGPIVDYKGNVLGVVTSSLNQAMMLQKTGTTTQNVNFGISHKIVSRFLTSNNIQWQQDARQQDLEAASKQAVDYTVQVLCYK
jgi:serine protease Do